MKNKCVKCKKNLRTNVWNFGLRQKWQIKLEKCVLVQQDVSSLSGYNQKVRKWNFFNLIRVRNKKQVSEVRKKNYKLTFGISNGFKKRQTENFKSCVAAQREGFLFSGFNQKVREGEIFKFVMMRVEKLVSEVRKNQKNWRFKYRYG